jgi:6,7-dimethyl-8-ribityllumazine synthase
MSPARRDSSRTRSAARLRAAVVVSRYNATVTDRLLEGARAEASSRGADLQVFDAPGSFELPAIAGALVRSGRFDVVAVLGCIIKGETEHDRFIAQAICESIAALSAHSGVPIGLGVLTVNTPEQALARAGGEQGNKGAEALAAAIETLTTIRSIGTGVSGARSIRSHDKLKARPAASPARRAGKGARRA